MKYFFTIISLSILLTACKKNDEPKPIIPDSTNDVGTSQKKAIDNFDKNKIRTSRGALDALIYIPGGGPIPPHLLPLKDITLDKESDSTAIYTFRTQIGEIKGKISMRKRITGSDTVWMVTGVEELR
jgi:hypothetical protein